MIGVVTSELGVLVTAQYKGKVVGAEGGVLQKDWLELATAAIVACTKLCRRCSSRFLSSTNCGKKSGLSCVGEPPAMSAGFIRMAASLSPTIQAPR